MDEFAYQSTLSWFEYANGQAYNSNGWAVAAAFAIFIYVLKDARDRLTTAYGGAASILLVVFAGVTSAGWALERDAAYKNLVQLEAGHRSIVSQDPTKPPQTQRTGNFGSWPLQYTIYGLTFTIAAGFAMGTILRMRTLSKAEGDGASA